MRKIDRLAFLAMALHGCGFMLAYELMQARPVPGGGLAVVAGAHFVCVIVAALVLPALARRGGAGRVVVCAVFLAAFATRLPGVDAWKDSVPFRIVMQMGQGSLAAVSYWVFFALTPREHWVRRYVMAWLAGAAGKELVLAAAGLAGDDSLSVLFIGAGSVFALLMFTASACVLGGDFSLPERNPDAERAGTRAFFVLTANTVLVAAFLGLLSGWIGPFHTMWGDASAVASRIAAPAMLLLVGWRLFGNFRTGFREMTGLCALLCFVIATLSVLRREAVPVRGIPILAVCCQTVFYACMTLALARTTHSPRLFGLATVVPYAAMIFAGAATYRAIPLRELDFSVVVLLCFIVFIVFYVCTKKIDFSLFPPPFAPGDDKPPGRPERMTLEQLADHFRFSARERETAALLAQGMSNAAVGAAMYLSQHTINSHVRNMCEKVGVSSRKELVGLLCADSEG